MNWKLLSLVAAAVTLSASSESRAFDYNNQGGIIITPSIPLNGPNGPRVLPSIRPGTFPNPPGIPTVPYPIYPPVPGPGIVQPYYPPVQPYDPYYGRNRFRGKNLERYIERCIRAKFGRLIDDVDVDIDNGDLEAEVEVEIRDRRYRRAVYNFVISIPELRGYRLDIDIDD